MKNLEKAGLGTIVKTLISGTKASNKAYKATKAAPKVIKRSISAKRTSTVKPANAKDAYKSINKKAGEQASINKHHSKLYKENAKSDMKAFKIAFGTSMLGVGAGGAANAIAGKDRKKNIKLAKTMVKKTTVKKPTTTKKK